MDDLLKAFGAAAGAGAGFAIAAIGWRVYHDDQMTWFVVGTGMLALLLVLGCVMLVLYRHAVEARRLAIEANLVAARVVRTLGATLEPRPSAPASGSDFLGALLAGAPTGDVIDVPVNYAGGDDNDD